MTRWLVELLGRGFFSLFLIVVPELYTGNPNSRFYVQEGSIIYHLRKNGMQFTPAVMSWCALVNAPAPELTYFLYTQTFFSVVSAVALVASVLRGERYRPGICSVASCCFGLVAVAAGMAATVFYFFYYDEQTRSDKSHEEKNALYYSSVAAVFQLLLVSMNALYFSPRAAYNHYGLNLLAAAAEEGDTAAVQILLNAGAAVNARNHDWRESTALLLAARKGQSKVVRLLLSRGAEVDGTDARGTTPLMEAAGEGKVDVVKILLKAGAQLNMTTDNGSTVLTRALSSYSVGVIDVLLSAGANADHYLISASALGKSAMVRKILDYAPNVNATSDGLTPLVGAIMSGHTEVVDVLIKAGVSIFKSYNGLSPLALAESRGQEEIAAMLRHEEKRRRESAWGRRGWLMLMREQDTRLRQGPQQEKKGDSEEQAWNTHAHAHAHATDPVGDARSM